MTRRERLTAEERRRRNRARLDRQFMAMRRIFPWLDGWIGHLQSDRAARFRFPLGILLTIGGLLWFLPVFGIWMLPVGLMLLALDVPALQGPISGQVVRWRRRIARLRSSWGRWIRARARRMRGWLGG